MSALENYLPFFLSFDCMPHGDVGVCAAAMMIEIGRWRGGGQKVITFVCPMCLR